jgi:hypothetical protein
VADGNVLRFYRNWSAEAPDELMAVVIVRNAPPLPFVPRELHGKAVVSVACCYAGRLDDAEKVVRPLGARRGVAACAERATSGVLRLR